MNRNLNADLMRILATISIVGIHCSASLLYKMNTVPSSWFWFANLYDSFFQWGVPIFVMLSGMLLLGNEESILVFLKKRLAKLIIPLVIWSFIYLLWKENNIITWQLVPKKKFLLDVLQGATYYHLWFIYMIIGLYLITPIIKVFVRNATNKEYLYFFSIWIIASCGYMVAKKFLNINMKIDLSFVTGWIGYYVLGYYLNNVDIPNKIRRIIYGLALVSLTVIVTGTYYLTKSNNFIFDNHLYLAFNLPVMITTIAVFLFIKNSKIDLSKKAIVILSNSCYQVYLSHLLIIEWLAMNKIDYKMFHPSIAIPLLIILVTLISFTVSNIIRFIYLLIAKIPLLKQDKRLNT